MVLAKGVLGQTSLAIALGRSTALGTERTLDRGTTAATEFCSIDGQFPDLRYRLRRRVLRVGCRWSLNIGRGSRLSKLTLVDETGARVVRGRTAAAGEINDEEDEGHGRGDAAQREQGDAATPSAVAAVVVVAVRDGARRAVEASSDGVQQNRGNGEADGPPLVQGAPGWSDRFASVGWVRHCGM